MYTLDFLTFPGFLAIISLSLVVFQLIGSIVLGGFDLDGADARKFEHLQLGNVTVVGGADAAPSFLSKVVEAVSKVNTLKDNIPGMGGLLGMLGSFDQKHQIPEKGAEESTKEEE